MKYLHKILLHVLLVLLIIRYIFETITYGTLGQKIFLLLFPLSFSWIGIKKLRKELNRKKEKEKLLEKDS